MLNRRILRVKAFQNLYAYEQCRSSNFNLAKDQIKEAFQPDLNSMEVQDKEALKKDAAFATQLFINHLESPSLPSGERNNPKVREEATKAINFYHAANKKDIAFLSKNMLSSAERTPQLYLSAIEILLAFAEHIGRETEKKKKFTGQKAALAIGEANLANNTIIKKLKESSEYQQALVRHHVDISDIELEIKEWFREYIRPFEAYQTYIQLDHPDIDQDLDITEDILKKVIFKTDAILNFFSEKDFNWTENKSITRSLATKLLRNIKENLDEDTGLLPEIALNWEEDKEFFENIFNLTVQNDGANKELIAQKTKNWEIDRIAQTDKIILSMAITEMTNFPSIPVKVSINEYIDISKTYSTPKSKQFVNGLLDVLAKDLTEKGQIRKSGRGLIDNQ